MKPCNHIISFSEGVDEAWVDYANKMPDAIYVEIVFNYCPICGEEIKQKAKKFNLEDCLNKGVFNKGV